MERDYYGQDPQPQYVDPWVQPQQTQPPTQNVYLVQTQPIYGAAVQPQYAAPPQYGGAGQPQYSAPPQYGAPPQYAAPSQYGAPPQNPSYNPNIVAQNNIVQPVAPPLFDSFTQPRQEQNQQPQYIQQVQPYIQQQAQQQPQYVQPVQFQQQPQYVQPSQFQQHPHYVQPVQMTMVPVPQQQQLQEQQAAPVYPRGPRNVIGRCKGAGLHLFQHHGRCNYILPAQYSVQHEHEIREPGGHIIKFYIPNDCQPGDELIIEY